MNVQLKQQPTEATASSSRLAIADGDLHPAVRSDKDLHPWLAKRWIDHLAQFGTPGRKGMHSGPAFPKSQPNASRRDAYPPEGGRQGSSLATMQRQHLDLHNVQLGILNPLGAGQGAQNPDLSSALASATNDWQLATWTGPDRRLKASVVINYEDPPSAVAEIHKRAPHPDFVQVIMLTRTAEPLGSRKYWPIYEAAAEAGLPIGVHAFGYGGNPITGGGWPSYYIEEMTGHSQTCQAMLTSFVVEGVFAKWPTLKLVLIEAGFAWAPSLAWRLDRTWKRLKAETPHLDRLPSEYIRDHVWWTTQPMEEPERREQLLDTIGWMGWDRLLYASDYPHWDYDDPAQCLPLKTDETQRRQFFMDNARSVYRLG